MPRSQSVSSSVQRLPVNPRRHRVAPEQRKRVAIACNNCNVRRIKCSGDRPCQQCSSSSRECQYPVTVDKVTIPRSELDELRARCAALEQCVQDAVPDSTMRQQLLSRVSTAAAAAAAANSSTQSPGSQADMTLDDEELQPAGKLLQDLDGTSRYMGETSGATFVDNVKQFMATIFPLAFNGAISDFSSEESHFLSSVGRYQTQDSRPLLAPSVDPLWLPPPAEMASRLQELRYFIQEDGGASGGIMYWGNLHDVPESPRKTATNPPIDLRSCRKLAFYHAAFAYSTLFRPAQANSKQDLQLGETFFARARSLLGSPFDISAYTSEDPIVIALMGLYLIEMNRRDACYMYIAIAMHIAIMHGVHRGWSIDERGKRIFWTIYVLDRWSSCVMGRPPTILDEGISLELPQEAPGLPSPVGLRANVELSRIAGYIVCNTYRIAPWVDTHQQGPSQVDRALQMLSKWLQDLPHELQISYELFSPDRPLCTLHMTYNQLLIIVIRPILFMAVKRAVADRFVSRQWSIEDHPQIGHIRECSDAARRNLRLGRWLQKTSPAQKLMMPDLHNIFNATIILLLHQIVFVNLRTNDISDIAFGIKAFEMAASSGDSYSNDCGKVLRELSALVQRLRNLMFEGIPQIDPHAATAAATAPVPAVTTPQKQPPAAAFSYGFMPMSEPEDNPVIQIQMPGGDALYQELVTWLDSDDSKMYTSYLV